jgi:hypothetical protein
VNRQACCRDVQLTHRLLLTATNAHLTIALQAKSRTSFRFSKLRYQLSNATSAG